MKTKKRFYGFLSLAIIFSVVFIFDVQTVQAACYNPYVYSEEVTISPQEYETDNVQIMCSGGYPSGWTSVRSTAKFRNKTSSGTKIYEKSGGYKKADSDFRTKIETKAAIRKYVKDDGSVTFVKSSSAGDVRLYKSSTEKYPSVWFGKEKIRYLE